MTTKHTRLSDKPWYILAAIISVSIIFLFVSGIFHFNTVAGEPLILTSPNGKKVYLTVEIAEEEDRRKLGLMHRKEMPLKQGMLFIWPEKNIRKMWMKNTYISLDFLFIEDNTVVGIIEGARPHDETLLGVHIPINKVLEVNAGIVSTYNITTGWKINH